MWWSAVLSEFYQRRRVWITYPPVNFLKSVTSCNFLPNEMFRHSELRELWVSSCNGPILSFEAIVARSGAASQARTVSAAPDFYPKSLYRQIYTFAMKNSRWGICAQGVGDM